MVGHLAHKLVGFSFLILLGLFYSIFVYSMNTGVLDSNSIKISVQEQLKNIFDKLRTGKDEEKASKTENDQIDNIMKKLRTSDKSLISKFLNVTPDQMTDYEAMDHFYQAISLPLQGVCRSLKRIGGIWYKGKVAKAVDGDKFICMDEFSLMDQCLIYSFGIK